MITPGTVATNPYKTSDAQRFGLAFSYRKYTISEHYHLFGIQGSYVSYDYEFAVSERDSMNNRIFGTILNAGKVSNLQTSAQYRFGLAVLKGNRPIHIYCGFRGDLFWYQANQTPTITEAYPKSNSGIGMTSSFYPEITYQPKDSNLLVSFGFQIPIMTIAANKYVADEPDLYFDTTSLDIDIGGRKHGEISLYLGWFF